jgi:hypothetical protein
MKPTRLFKRSEVLVRRGCPVPKERGLYGWYFKQVPDPRIDTTQCIEFDGCHLLYVGIAPQDEQSKTSSLQSRIKDHYRSWTTLRVALGSLLADELGLTPKSKNLRWEQNDHLSEWMAENAFVVWVENSEPWNIEPDLIQDLDLPLNIVHNSDHPFCKINKAARARQKEIAIRMFERRSEK